LKTLSDEEISKYNAKLRTPLKQLQAKAGNNLNIRIPTKNSGTDDWPPETNLYLVDYTKVSPFLDRKTSIEVGHCSSNSNRPEAFDIVVPEITGIHEFKFRYGIEELGLFGETFTI
jgi:hypothetical protein